MVNYRFKLTLLFCLLFCITVKAVPIYAKPADAEKADYILEKNDNGIWMKKMYFPINNLITKETYIFNINNNLWEKSNTQMNSTINPILRINKDGTKDISYNLGLKWFKSTEDSDDNNENINVYFDCNERIINYKINKIDYSNIQEIALFALSGKELYRTNQIQNEGRIYAIGITSQIVFVCFKSNNNYVTKKVIIQ
jgi:hypothetical protein